MPEHPDIVVCVERLQGLIVGKVVDRVRLLHPFVVRTVEPPLASVERQRVIGCERLGKRIVIGLERQLFLLVHLMLSGRLLWRRRGAEGARRNGLLALDFPSGSLLLTESSSHKRASVHIVSGRSALREFDRGGVEPLEVTATQFEAALRRENRTLKRALTDPRIVSGIGNAFSDEILHQARLSPVKHTAALDHTEVERLHRACQTVLRQWVQRLRAEAGDGLPERVTGSHEGMAVHGRYRMPCPDCGTAIQRIRYAKNEVDYCPRCQTDGRILADRALSRLLRKDWPRSIEELEERQGKR